MTKLIPGICTQCGATLSVDEEKDAMICPYCNVPFIVKGAIENFAKMINNIISNSDRLDMSMNKNVDKDFEIVGGVLVKYTGTGLDVVIPDGVSKLGDALFEGMMIKSVIIPDSVKIIGNNVFKDCVNLKEITLPDNLETIGAFSLCGFKELVIPKSVKNISFDTFLPYFYGSNKILETLRVSKDVFDKIAEGSTSAHFIKLINIFIDGEKIDFHDELATKIFHTLLSNKYFEYQKQIEQQKITQRNTWKQLGHCQYCGGEFTGFFTRTCIKCGKGKDY